MCNSFLLCLFKVKVKLEPHEEQIFVDDDDEVSVSYMYLQYRPCFIVLKVYLFYPEKNSSSEMWFLLVPLIWMVTQTSGGSREGARGGAARPPVPYFWTKQRALGPKKIFWRPGPPLSRGLDDCPSPPTPYLKVWIRHCRLTVTKISNFCVYAFSVWRFQKLWGSFGFIFPFVSYVGSQGSSSW